MEPVFKDLTPSRANLYLYILEASSIAHSVQRGFGGWDILVPSGNRQAALSAVEEYLEEGDHWVPPAPAQPRRSFCGLWVAAFLLAWHLSVETLGGQRHLFVEAGASASHIMKGELWRTVTALTLHGDALHLAGNMAGIAVFGTAVCQVAGTGAGWCMVLAAGIAGNLANAAFYRDAHLSVGASTAIFGAVGILGARRLVAPAHEAGGRSKRWVTLGGGLALLALLGNSPRADLTAHLFGWLAGLALGAGYGLVGTPHFSGAAQLLFSLAAACALILSWLRVLVGN